MFQKLYSLLVAMVLGTAIAQAQLPVCNIIYGKTSSRDTIINYNPALPVSATNPAKNTIDFPASSYGLTVSPVLKSSSTTLTFYSVDSATRNYIYYNPTTSSWVNTGHGTGDPLAVNIAAGGGYIFSLVGSTGDVYRYDGSGTGTFLVKVPGFSLVGPYDLLADCEGNFFIFNQSGSTPFLRQYSSSGTLLKSWVYSNPLGLTVAASAGFAIFGTKLYTDNSVNRGIASYDLGFDTVKLVSTTGSLGNNINDDLGSCAGSILTIPIAEISESENNVCVGRTVTYTAKTLGGGSAPSIQWFVNGSLVSSGGSTYSYKPANGDKIYCILTSSSPCASVPTDTSNVIVMNVFSTVPPPTVSSPLSYCQFATAPALTATGSALLWYSTATGGTGSVSAPIPSTTTAGSAQYYVSQSIGGCESSRAIIKVDVNPAPAAPVSPTPVNLCRTVATTPLTAKGTGLKWYTLASGGTGSSTAPTPSVSTSGTVHYYVSQTVSGCESPRTDVTVVVSDTAKAPAAYNPVDFCKGTPATALTAIGTSLKWYTVATGGTALGAAPIPSTTSSGTVSYYVSQTCPGVAIESPRTKIDAVVHDLPVFSISSKPSPLYYLCKNSDVLLRTTGGGLVAWQWDTAGTAKVGAIADSFLVTKTGKWGVTGTDNFGCKNRNEVTVQRDTTSKPVLSPTTALICREGNLLMTCSPGFYKYKFEWMKEGVIIPGSTGNTWTATADGIYAVRVTNSAGCIDTTNLLLIGYYPVPIKPIVTISGRVLSVAAGYTYYQWYRNGIKIPKATARSYNAGSAGKFFVEITDANGCLNRSDTVTMENPSGITEQHSGLVKIYPNPTQGIVHIDATQECEVQIRSLMGVLVGQVKGSGSIDLNGLSGGVYLVYVLDSEQNLQQIERLIYVAQP